MRRTVAIRSLAAIASLLLFAGLASATNVQSQPATQVAAGSTPSFRELAFQAELQKQAQKQAAEAAAAQAAQQAAEQAKQAAAAEVQRQAEAAARAERLRLAQQEAQRTARASVAARAAVQPRPAPAPVSVPAAGPTDPGSNRALGQQMAADHGWVGSQWTCLDQLWGDYESGWRTNAGSPSAAYGIPQSYPGNKMRSEGADWMTNPVTQIKWGIGYIQSSYHNDPCAALYKRLHSSPPGY